MEVRRDDGYVISTDKARLDVDYIHHYIAEESYWARGRSREVQERAIANSLCFGVYKDGAQVGFARAVTDCATLGWLADVFVDERHRGRGLGKWLVETLLSHPDLARVRKFMLTTSDAHELYRRYGFSDLSRPDQLMERIRRA